MQLMHILTCGSQAVIYFILLGSCALIFPAVTIRDALVPYDRVTMVPMHVYIVQMPAGFPIVCWLLKSLSLVLLYGQMPGLLWFLCPVPFGSFAEFSMGRMPFPNVPMPVYPWFLFLVPYVSYPYFLVDPEPGSFFS